MRALPALTSPIRETTLWLFWQVAPGNKARFHSAVQNFIKRSFCTQSGCYLLSGRRWGASGWVCSAGGRDAACTAGVLGRTFTEGRLHELQWLYTCIESSQNGLGWKGHHSPPSSNPCHGLVAPHQFRLFRAASHPAFSTSRSGAPTALWAESSSTSLSSE